MASKSKEQLETELTEALALVEKLTTDKKQLEADNAALAKDLEHVEGRLKEALSAKPGSAVEAPLTEDEQDIRSRVRAGLTREQAEHAHHEQKRHDAAMKAAAAAK